MKINMKQVICAVFILVFVSFCTGESETCQSFEIKTEHLNKQLVGHSVAESIGLELKECVEECMSLAVCKSTDYYTLKKTCKLNDVNSSSVDISEFRPLNGAVFSDISEWPSMMAGSCSPRPCANSQRCYDVMDNFHCVDLTCKMPSIANGKLQLSAWDNNKFLDTATVQCRKGHIPNITSVKCQASGTWEQATCAPVTDCQDIVQIDPDSVSGVYDILLWKSKNVLSVFCDMDTDGGGWTVFQRRIDGMTDFYRNLSEYTNGFGSADAEFWLGLKNIQEITQQSRTKLRIDMSSENGTEGYETFQDFGLTGQEYILSLGSRSNSSNAGKAEYGMSNTIGMRFGTYDHDIDILNDDNCPVIKQGGWWFVNCSWVVLNGEYCTPGTKCNDEEKFAGHTHYGFAGRVSLKTSSMMIRRVNK